MTGGPRGYGIVIEASTGKRSAREIASSHRHSCTSGNSKFQTKPTGFAKEWQIPQCSESCNGTAGDFSLWPPDSSDLEPSYPTGEYRSGGGGSRANKFLKNPSLSPLVGYESGRRMRPRAATRATAQRQLRSITSSIEVAETAKSSTTFDSES